MMKSFSKLFKDLRLIIEDKSLYGKFKEPDTTITLPSELILKSETYEKLLYFQILDERIKSAIRSVEEFIFNRSIAEKYKSRSLKRKEIDPESCRKNIKIRKSGNMKNKVESSNQSKIYEEKGKSS